MVFDNSHYRAKSKENYVPAGDNFSRGVRYRINTEAMTIEQMWQFGKERGASFFSTYISNVEYYDEGHYMVHSGGTGVLQGEESTHRYFVPTTKRPFLAMCVGPFQKSDERAVEHPISKEGLKGNFKVTLLIDDKKYETGVVITC